MASIVGGIFYRPQQKKELRDIYGESINLPNLFSSQHAPIVVTSPIASEYAQPYVGFNKLKESSKEEAVDAEPIVLEDVTPEMVTANESEVVFDSPNKFTSNEAAWNNAWSKYGSNLGIKDQKAYAYLIGQIKHESDDFKYNEEIASGDNYEGRTDLGNVQRGDGRKYKGRGPIQVTGRNNYEKIYKDFFVPNGLGEYDIVNNPELARDPYIGSLLSIGWLATTDDGKKAIEAVNKYDVRAATYAINGGYNGLDDRIKRTNNELKHLV